MRLFYENDIKMQLYKLKFYKDIDLIIFWV